MFLVSEKTIVGSFQTRNKGIKYKCKKKKNPTFIGGQAFRVYKTNLYCFLFCLNFSVNIAL